MLNEHWIVFSPFQQWKWLLMALAIRTCERTQEKNQCTIIGTINKGSKCNEKQDKKPNPIHLKHFEQQHFCFSSYEWICGLVWLVNAAVRWNSISIFHMVFFCLIVHSVRMNSKEYQWLNDRRASALNQCAIDWRNKQQQKKHKNKSTSLKRAKRGHRAHKTTHRRIQF